MQVWLPELFWQDHFDRELPAGTLIRRAGTRVLVEATEAELTEIREDAEFYADPWGPDFGGEEYGRRLKASAKRTVSAIDKVLTREK